MQNMYKAIVFIAFFYFFPLYAQNASRLLGKIEQNLTPTQTKLIVDHQLWDQSEFIFKSLASARVRAFWQSVLKDIQQLKQNLPKQSALAVELHVLEVVVKNQLNAFPDAYHFYFGASPFFALIDETGLTPPVALGQKAASTLVELDTKNQSTWEFLFAFFRRIENIIILAHRLTPPELFPVQTLKTFSDKIRSANRTGLGIPSRLTQWNWYRIEALLELEFTQKPLSFLNGFWDELANNNVAPFKSRDSLRARFGNIQHFTSPIDLAKWTQSLSDDSRENQTSLLFEFGNQRRALAIKQVQAFWKDLANQIKEKLNYSEAYAFAQKRVTATLELEQVYNKIKPQIIEPNEAKKLGKDAAKKLEVSLKNPSSNKKLSAQDLIDLGLAIEQALFTAYQLYPRDLSQTLPPPPQRDELLAILSINLNDFMTSFWLQLSSVKGIPIRPWIRLRLWLGANPCLNALGDLEDEDNEF